MESYLSKFFGHFQTGDAGFIEEDNHVHIMSRTVKYFNFIHSFMLKKDDVINVAGHRLSTGQIEQVIASHPVRDYNFWNQNGLF